MTNRKKQQLLKINDRQQNHKSKKVREHQGKKAKSYTEAYHIQITVNQRQGENLERSRGKSLLTY